MDKSTRYEDNGDLTKNSSLYSERLVGIRGRRWSGHGKLNDWIVWLREILKEVMKRTVHVFGENCKTELFTMEFNHFHHLFKDLGSFES